MHLSATLSFYIGRQFLLGIGTVFAVLASLVFMVEMVELLRRASGNDQIGFFLVLEMTALKLPATAQQAIPFAALFGAMLTFSRLTRTQELVVARAAGVSVWQFLTPAIAIALGLGALIVTVGDPVSSILAAKYERVEAKYLRGRASLLALSSSGLWLRQADPGGQTVIHAAKISQRGIELSEVTVFLFEGSDRFIGRIDAKRARLHHGFWELEEAVLNGPDRPRQSFARHRIDTTLTVDEIQDSFATPETLSFWRLPAFIETLEAAGFSALRHRLHWHKVLAGPILLCAMVLIAATFSLRLTRRGGTGLLLGGGVLTGFFLYFLSDVVFALGRSGGLPVVMAAWTPACVTTLLGLSMLFHLEDG